MRRVDVGPYDFRARSIYGPVPGAEVADWPFQYDELEPWYDRVEKLVGVSGTLRPMPAGLTDRRSSPAFPLPPTREHPFAGKIDETCRSLGLHPYRLPRAVLPGDFAGRGACDYNGYCGSCVCTTGAKGSALASWIPRALEHGAEIRPRAMVRSLVTDASGKKIVAAEYIDREGRTQRVEARAFVVACQAIESARLLLNSRSRAHPRGLANESGQVGRNLIFSTFAMGWGEMHHADQADGGAWLLSDEPFINRMVLDYYWFDPADPQRRNAGTTAPARGMRKGGTLNFLRMHPNPIGASELVAFGTDPSPVPLWGDALKKKLDFWLHDMTAIKFEVFGEWLPGPHSSVTLDPQVKDKWGLPVARIQADNHPISRRNAAMLVGEGKRIVGKMGARNVRTVRHFGGPSVNLQAGTCRAGDDPKTSVLDRDCKAHGVENLYVTDGSFMPSAGCVPFTFTIYANALRVAEVVRKRV